MLLYLVIINRLKSIISILLCSVFLFQPLSKLLILLDYEVNKATITQNFCENKSKPKLHCNGKCHLKKQLEKEDKKQDSFPTASKEKSEIQFHSSPSVFALTITCSEVTPNFTYLLLYPDTPVYSIFHPPSFA